VARDVPDGDAGHIGSSERTGRIVALDGLVSHTALGYWSQRRIDDYVRDAHVRFIADDPPTVERAQRFTRSRPQLEERHTFPLRGWPTGRRMLWEVEPDRAMTR
jgi:hypothetical protein